MEKILPVIDSILISKLESISFDIKMYINSYTSLASAIGETSNRNQIKFFTQEELDEILDIRKRLKTLSQKLKERYESEKV